MPKKIFEGLGPGTLIPQRGKLPLDDPKLGPQEGFVLSRVDGQTSLEEICLLVPFDEPTTMVILRRLWELGAIEVPGVARVIMPHAPVENVPVVIEDSVTSKLPGPPPPRVSQPPPSNDPKPSADGQAGEGLSAAQLQRIDDFYNHLDQKDAFELLEIERSADDKGVKRAYFKLSKEFHPDRFFGKDIGVYKERLTKIFQALKAAFEVLSDKRRRAAYEESVGSK